LPVSPSSQQLIDFAVKKNVIYYKSVSEKDDDEVIERVKQAGALVPTKEGFHTLKEIDSAQAFQDGIYVQCPPIPKNLTFQVATLFVKDVAGMRETLVLKGSHSHVVLIHNLGDGTFRAFAIFTSSETKNMIWSYQILPCGDLSMVKKQFMNFMHEFLIIKNEDFIVHSQLTSYLQSDLAAYQQILQKLKAHDKNFPNHPTRIYAGEGYTRMHFETLMDSHLISMQTNSALLGKPGDIIKNSPSLSKQIYDDPL